MPVSHLHEGREKEALLARIRRLKGQIEAIERAVQADRDCGAILHLVASVRGAMTGLTSELIDEHLIHHVRDMQDPAVRAQGAAELSRALRSYLR
jgi:DNA-binding FrmR family transcriptional regulator